MVERLPTLPEADQLRRLSPTRRLPLPAGPATVRTRIAAPTPGRTAFDTYVVVPGQTNVGVRIETAGGQRLVVLDSTTRFGSLRRPTSASALLRALRP